MPILDPNKKDENENGVPAGDYLIAFKTLEGKTSKAGNRYLNIRAVIVAGPAKKRSFFAMVTLTENALPYLRRMLRALGSTEPFDTDSDGQCRRAMLMRPFKVTVSRTQDGDFVNNRIERILEPTLDEKQTMDNWVAEQAEAGDFATNGGGDDGMGGYIDAPHAANSDDDIPF